MEYHLKIGDMLWTFDINHRVYAKTPEGRSTGGPIYEKHFRPVVISGENYRSWIISPPDSSMHLFTVPKSRPFYSGKLFTDKLKEENIWKNRHSYQIARKVESCSIDQLKIIADIIHYNGGDNVS